MQTLVSVAIVLMISAIGAVTATGCESDAIMYTGQNNARRYAQKMGIRAVGVSCSTRDSDGDGYTSCDLNTGERIIVLECSYRSGGGCKDRRGSVKVSAPSWQAIHR